MDLCLLWLARFVGIVNRTLTMAMEGCPRKARQLLGNEAFRQIPTNNYCYCTLVKMTNSRRAK